MRGTGNAGGLTGQRHQVRTVKDLEVTAKALSGLFSTDTVVVVGSQAILVGWPEAPSLMRTSPEIDAYPANARAWERRKAEGGEPDAEASEEINALLGEGSPFQERHGFFVDGVDERTATLPTGWQTRATYREVKDDGKAITVVAPSPADLFVSKAGRLAEKDVNYIRAYHAVRPVDVDKVCRRLALTAMTPQEAERAEAFFRSLPPGAPAEPDEAQNGTRIPRCPEGSHCVFYDARSGTFTVRKWDEELGIFNKVDNPIDAASTTVGLEKHFLDGARMSKADWEAAPRVLEAAGSQEPDGPVPTF